MFTTPEFHATFISFSPDDRENKSHVKFGVVTNLHFSVFYLFTLYSNTLQWKPRCIEGYPNEQGHLVAILNKPIQKCVKYLIVLSQDIEPL